MAKLNLQKSCDYANLVLKKQILSMVVLRLNMFMETVMSAIKNFWGNYF